MIARSSALTSAGLRYTDERGSASNRHCWDIGSAEFTRSTIVRRSARLSCRAFVPKNHFRPSTGRSAGTEGRPALHWWFPPPMRRPRRRSPPHLAVASSSCGSGSGAPQMHRQLGDGAVAPDCRHRHLRLERRTVLLPRPLHVLLPRYTRFLGAGLHLGHLSHFRGPAQTSRRSINSSWARERFGLRSRKAEKLSLQIVCRGYDEATA